MRKTLKYFLLIVSVLVASALVFSAVNYLLDADEREQLTQIYKSYHFDDSNWINISPKNSGLSVGQFSAKIPRNPWEHSESVDQITISAIGQHIGESDEYGVGEDVDVLESFHIAVIDLGINVEDPVDAMQGALDGLISSSNNNLIWSQMSSHDNMSAIDFYIEKLSLVNQRGRYVIKGNILYYLFLNHRKELDIVEVNKAFGYFADNFEIY